MIDGRGRVAMILLCGTLLAATQLVAQEEKEEEEEEPAWSTALGLAYLATSGNSDTETLGLDLKTVRRPEPWGLELIALFNRAEESGALTAERSFLGLRGTRSVAERWAVFAGLSGEKDVFAGIDPRYLLEAGALYTAVDSPRHVLTFDLGISRTDETRVEVLENGTEVESSVDYLGAVAGLAWQWKLGDSASVTQRLLYYPSFEESTGWRSASESGIQAAVSSWLALKLSFELRYRSLPVGDNDDTDTTTKASVVLTF